MQDEYENINFWQQEEKYPVYKVVIDDSKIWGVTNINFEFEPNEGFNFKFYGK
jgi:hypothetical protein